MEIKIENLKCAGCATSIKNDISAIEGISDVRVIVETSTVSFTADDESKVEEVKTRLSKLGYPPEGSENNLGHKAKSFVSCAVGRMSS